MIVFLIEDKGLHETIYTDTMEHVIDGYIYSFKWYIVGLTAALTLYLFIFIISLIHTKLIKPIVALTDHINNTS